MTSYIKPYHFVTVTPVVLNNDAYDANDVVFDSTLVSNCSRLANMPTVLDSITFIDTNDQTAAALTFWVLNGNVSFGTKDSAPGISDADALYLQGFHVMAAASILDVGGAKLGFSANVNIPIKPVTDTRDCYIAMTSAGTPTYLTGCITLRLGFRTP